MQSSTTTPEAIAQPKQHGVAAHATFLRVHADFSAILIRPTSLRLVGKTKKSWPLFLIHGYSLTGACQTTVKRIHDETFRDWPEQEAKHKT
jgi:hypothetical protein